VVIVLEQGIQAGSLFIPYGSISECGYQDLKITGDPAKLTQERIAINGVMENEICANICYSY